MNPRRTRRALALNRRHYRAGENTARQLWLALHHWARCARRPVQRGITRWPWLREQVLYGSPLVLAEHPYADWLPGAVLWEQLVRQRDKVSERLTWLAEHEGEAEWEERREATRRSSALFAERLVALADWAGVTPGDVEGLLLEQEARR